jgi:hypothetical protein
MRRETTGSPKKIDRGQLAPGRLIGRIHMTDSIVSAVKSAVKSAIDA